MLGIVFLALGFVLYLAGAWHDALRRVGQGSYRTSSMRRGEMRQLMTVKTFR
ncbi:MAG: hypothetical protein JO216_15170 [Hyphomicrobiales bacterium]|nr:hypothetical protein [Hyphomicrobiales bacterium]